MGLLIYCAHLYEWSEIYIEGLFRGFVFPQGEFDYEDEWELSSWAMGAYLECLLCQEGEFDCYA